MQFRYFAGPRDEMSALCPEDRACSLCGAVGPCFRLEYAICPGMTDQQKEDAVGCFNCLRGGWFEFWHDTEIGLLDENGLTHCYNHNKPPPPGFPESVLVELRRTPQFITWQQELWLVHCNDFMTYLGTWEPADFYANAEVGDGRSLFLEMTDPDYQHLWDESLRKGEERLEAWHAAYYAFRCNQCGRLRGNWDCD